MVVRTNDKPMVILGYHFGINTFINLIRPMLFSVFQLYHGGDMIYDYGMRRRKPEPTFLPVTG